MSNTEMSLVVFVHRDPAASEPHTWSLALVPPQDSLETECTFYYIYNRPSIADPRVRAGPLTSDQCVKSLNTRMPRDSYTGVYKICNFPATEEDTIIGVLDGAVMQTREDWDDVLLHFLMGRGWVSDQQAVWLSKAMWDYISEPDEEDEDEDEVGSEGEGTGNGQDVLQSLDDLLVNEYSSMDDAIRGMESIAQSGGSTLGLAIIECTTDAPEEAEDQDQDQDLDVDVLGGGDPFEGLMQLFRERELNNWNLGAGPVTERTVEGSDDQQVSQSTAVTDSRRYTTVTLDIAINGQNSPGWLFNRGLPRTRTPRGQVPAMDARRQRVR
ncbi:uncharacterized protein BDV14DRAFT_198967 [Aspergillus stella-maris]|uniref:uncharacterized protein n=1 Tax=Aspergillus stella-maris TaxID=1810926 RepID=UPI003CCDF73C